jgi:lysophospholipid acyltransferase (LPLAT)-like uncharacterized protein
VAALGRLVLTWRYDTVGCTTSQIGCAATQIGRTVGSHGRMTGCDSGYVLAVPHMSLLIVAGYARDTGLATMVSHSGDGDLAAALLRGLGYRTARGSSSTGAVAGFRSLVRMAREHPVAGLTVDGPRGPAWQVQDGVVALARSTALPIVPMVATGPGIRWPSWDRIRIPWPGAKCSVRVGRAISVAADSDMAQVRHLVEDELLRLRSDAGIDDRRTQ